MRITSSVVVERPAEVLFELSQDYKRRLEWDSYLSEAFLLGNAQAANVGVECHCKSRLGAVMVSRYISYSPPTHAAVEMVQGPAVLRKFGGTWRFRHLKDQTTEVQFIYNFRVRPEFLSGVLEPLIAALYGRSMRRRAQAFKAWAENNV